ncbi:MAG: DUF2145 domain-containing protein [Lysobacteraceae bacterium]|nr:MAG: DUF2145 domain-containing protein [Xanthomonadaceae bacterium]
MSRVPPERSVKARMTVAGALLASMLCALVALFVLDIPTARAGNDCDARPLAPARLADAAQTGLLVAAELDKRDAPVALVSRVGTDLSKHGLVYSHAGFAVRDHPDGRWTVVHMLSDCSAEGSGLYAEGLVNFFADDLVRQDARITWLRPKIAEQLARRLTMLEHDPLYTPRYNLIARPGSPDYQNSTAWVLEHIAAAASDRDTGSRAQAYRLAQAHGFVPDRIHIPYRKRIMGGLFAKNMSFTDHSIATRLSGDYPVITVRSILRWLGASGFAQQELERRMGVWSERPGPG